MRFENKVVFITGAARGIGRAITESFAKEGALLALADLDEEELDRVAEELRKTSGKVITYKLDVTKENMVKIVTEKAISDFGGIDILINNAGVSTMNYFWNLSEKEWDFNMEVNTKGIWLTSKYVAPHMMDKKNGKIVNTASMAGKMGAALESHYAASKFGVIGFTQAAAQELAPYGINMNCVCPGFVKTAMQDREALWEAKLKGVQDPQDIVKDYIRQTPLGRLCYPEDVAKVVLFLASSDADFMTGQAINVTGGACMH
jgi:meso-butanediol dehydrogenase / (S,S)-butanediol dehydrogenase / diacetyl reductase